MHGERGQGTVEYAGVVLLVALVLAAAIAALVATGIGPKVVEQVRCAILQVAGESCEELAGAVAGPCVTASDRHSRGQRVSLLVVGAGTRKVLLREQRADGTVAITLVDERAAGLDANAGTGLRVRWGTFDRAVGSELRAAVMAGSASGRTWIAANAVEAEALTARVRIAEMDFARDRFPAPEPRVTFEERRTGVELRLGRPRDALWLSPSEAYGERVDHETGQRTVYVRDALGAEGRVGLGRFSAKGRVRGEERYAITFDRDGRPVDLAVLATLRVEGAAGLPRKLARVAGQLRIPLRGERHIETEQHLDLTDPVNAEFARSFFARFGAGKVAVRVAAGLLAERLERNGSASVRAYETDGTAHRVSGGLPGAALDVGSEDESSRLTSAVARSPEGAWGQDPACARAT